MCLQNVVAEVILAIAPYRVDMIGIVLGHIELDQE